jgi:hypothetical protein
MKQLIPPKTPKLMSPVREMLPKELLLPRESYLQQLDQCVPSYLDCSAGLGPRYQWFMLEPEQLDVKKSQWDLQWGLHQSNQRFQFHWHLERHHFVDVDAHLLPPIHGQEPVAHLNIQCMESIHAINDKDLLQELMMMVWGKGLTQLEQQLGHTLMVNPYPNVNLNSNSPLAESGTHRGIEMWHKTFMGEFYGPHDWHCLVKIQLAAEVKVVLDKKRYLSAH